MKNIEFKSARTYKTTHSEMIKEVTRRSKKEKMSMPILIEEMWGDYKGNQ